jgi:hypothetical protein
VSAFPSSESSVSSLTTEPWYWENEVFIGFCTFHQECRYSWLLWDWGWKISSYYHTSDCDWLKYSMAKPFLEATDSNGFEFQNNYLSNYSVSWSFSQYNCYLCTEMGSYCFLTLLIFEVTLYRFFFLFFCSAGDWTHALCKDFMPKSHPPLFVIKLFKREHSSTRYWVGSVTSYHISFSHVTFTCCQYWSYASVVCWSNSHWGPKPGRNYNKLGEMTKDLLITCIQTLSTELGTTQRLQAEMWTPEISQLLYSFTFIWSFSASLSLYRNTISMCKFYFW